MKIECERSVRSTVLLFYLCFCFIYFFPIAIRMVCSQQVFQHMVQYTARQRRQFDKAKIKKIRKKQYNFDYLMTVSGLSFLCNPFGTIKCKKENAKTKIVDKNKQWKTNSRKANSNVNNGEWTHKKFTLKSWSILQPIFITRDLIILYI